jgi:hypothetical protein
VKVEFLVEHMLKGMSGSGAWRGNVVVYVDDAEVDRVVVVDVEYCGAVV